MNTQIYRVEGMTCAHCASTVEGSLRALEGVQDVQVDVPAGRVTVHSAAPLPDEAVEAAVTGAGYQPRGRE